MPGPSLLHMQTNPYTLLILACALASSALADVTINFNIDSLRDSTGSEVSVTSLGLIVADTGANGFSNLSVGNISTNSLIGADDLIVGRFDYSSFGTGGAAQVAITNTFSKGWSPNNQLAVIWLPSLTLTRTSLSGGESYGMVTLSSWLTPGDSGSNATAYQILSTTQIGFFSSNANTLSISNLQSRASLNVSAIPEPTTFAALFGAAALGLAAFRRRRTAA